MDLTSKIYFENAAAQKAIPDKSVDLVVTSPPYPMIEMWDECFSTWDKKIETELDLKKGETAFEYMHAMLDEVWSECARVLKDNAFACINIGDATRKIGDEFKLYSNHSRITKTFMELGFDCLPVILWRKQTNAPNKFMGSGMLPSGAYVTLEHEYILIFRKGGKRVFKKEEKVLRRESAFFWEERNIWFSDTWDFKGVKQKLKSAISRDRSGAYPIELVHRLINMYSMKADTVLDPFMGTGTTLNGCILNGRKCIGYEIDSSLKDLIAQNTALFASEVYNMIEERFNNHNVFIEEYSEKKGPPKYTNTNHGFPVITSQEQILRLDMLSGINIEGEQTTCSYETFHPGKTDTLIAPTAHIDNKKQMDLFG